MSDAAKIKVGKPYSTSRKMEKAMKKKTHKVRRSQGKKLCNVCRFTSVPVGVHACQNCE